MRAGFARKKRFHSIAAAGKTANKNAPPAETKSGRAWNETICPPAAPHPLNFFPVACIVAAVAGSSAINAGNRAESRKGTHMDIKHLAEKHNDYIIAQRRRLHQCPELSLQEEETTKILKELLEAMGIPVTTFPDYNGLVGVVQGASPGPTVMLRADIDALPVQEKTGLPFASTNGNMHACGHDTHMAMLLGAARILQEVKGEIPGVVKLLFQSGEETCAAAKYYVDHGVLDDCACVFGMHIWADVDAARFSFENGPLLASCDNFRILVDGVSAHGSAPHLGKDAIVAAASIVMNLQTYVSRENNPQNPLVLTVGTLNAGQRFNIIANHAVLEGTIRTYSRELRKRLDGDLRRIVKGTAEALGCTAELEYISSLGPVVNDHGDLVLLARSAAAKLYGEDSLAPMGPIMGSEDFAQLMEKVPGVFGFVGCRNRAAGIVHPNHNDRFDVDESALHRGAALYAQFAVDFLSR